MKDPGGEVAYGLLACASAEVYNRLRLCQPVDAKRIDAGSQTCPDSAQTWSRFVNSDQVLSSEAQALPRLAFELLRVSPPAREPAYDHNQAHDLRRKILGALIRRGRLAAECEADDCSRALNVHADLIEAWELGRSAPSLPQLESLSRLFQSPESAEAEDDEQTNEHAEYKRIRRSLIGALLQSARLAQARSLEDLSAMTGLEADLLRRYEFGEAPLPAHHLMALAHTLERDLYFFVDSPPVRRVKTSAQTMRPAKHQDEDARLTQFAADRRNRAFIRLAMAFRDMDSAALDQVASALLAIVRDSQETTSPSQS